MKALPFSLLFSILIVALLGTAQNSRPLWAAPPQDQPIEVEASVDRSTITVGDRIKLRLTVHQPPGIKVGIPTRDFAATEDIEVLEFHSLPTKRAKDGAETLQFEYILTSFSTGQRKIPPIPVPYVNPSGQGALAFSQEVPILVESVLEKGGPAEDIRDIKHPLSLTGGLYPYRGWAGLALSTALLGLFILALTRRPWLTSPKAKEVLSMPPEDWARVELERIASLRLVDKKDYKTYYALVSFCTRKYLSARYGLEAMGLTSQELRREMEVKGINRWQARVMYGLLEECDLVRWAQYIPAEARAQRALALAYEIVDMASPSTVAQGA